MVSDDAEEDPLVLDLRKWCQRETQESHWARTFPALWCPPQTWQALRQQHQQAWSQTNPCTPHPVRKCFLQLTWVFTTTTLRIKLYNVSVSLWYQRQWLTIRAKGISFLECLRCCRRLEEKRHMLHVSLYKRLNIVHDSVDMLPSCMWHHSAWFSTNILLMHPTSMHAELHMEVKNMTHHQSAESKHPRSSLGHSRPQTRGSLVF